MFIICYNSYWISLTETVLSPLSPPQPFYGRFSGTTQVSRCHKKASSVLYGTRADADDNPGGRHSIRINQQSTSINPSIFLRRMPFLPQPSQFILVWNSQRNMLDCIAPWLGWKLSYHRPVMSCQFVQWIDARLMRVPACVFVCSVRVVRWVGACWLWWRHTASAPMLSVRIWPRSFNKRRTTNDEPTTVSNASHAYFT